MLAALKACLFGTALARFCSLWILLVATGAVFGTALSGWDPGAIDWDALVDARPWYAQELVNGKGFFAGNYTMPRRAIIFLANRGQEAGEFEVQIDKARLPSIGGDWRVRYILGRQGGLGLLGDGKLKMTLPALNDGPIGLELVPAD
jgi:hypothetical protein